MDKFVDTNFPVSDAAVTAAAALSMCESLVIALNDLKILSDDDARAVLEDAANAHREAIRETPEKGTHHLAVAVLIERILAGRNSVRELE